MTTTVYVNGSGLSYSSQANYATSISQQNSFSYLMMPSYMADAIMSIFKILFSISFTLIILTGCATTNSNLISNEDEKDKCFHRHVKVTTSYTKVETTKTKEFFEPSKTFSGIGGVNFKNMNVELTFVDKIYFEQYVAPAIDTIKETYFDSQPLTWLGLTLGTGGVAPVIGAIEGTNSRLNALLVGCTDRELVESKPDTTKKVKTGKSEWRDFEGHHKIRMSGFDKDYEFTVASNNAKIGHPEYGYAPGVETTTGPLGQGISNGVGFAMAEKLLAHQFNKAGHEIVDPKIDLTAAILNTKLTKNTNLTIQCVDCDLLGSEEQSLFPNAKTSILLSNDFNPVKQSLMDAEKIRLTEEAKGKVELITREKELEIQAKKQAKEDGIRKALEAKAALEIERKKQELPLDEFKMQCELLGFKVGTEKFGKCVLDLNETKSR